MKKEMNGYITLYLTLILGVMLSLVFVLLVQQNSGVVSIPNGVVKLLTFKSIAFNTVMSITSSGSSFSPLPLQAANEKIVLSTSTQTSSFFICTASPFYFIFAKEFR